MKHTILNTLAPRVAMDLVRKIASSSSSSPTAAAATTDDEPSGSSPNHRGEEDGKNVQQERSNGRRDNDFLMEV
jgi:hypothetical protein